MIYYLKKGEKINYLTYPKIIITVFFKFLSSPLDSEGEVLKNPHENNLYIYFRKIRYLIFALRKREIIYIISFSHLWLNKESETFHNFFRKKQ